MDIADIVVSLVSGATGAAAFSWIVRTWLAERLKQSIGYEYSQKLESHKTELNSKLQLIQHENQVNQIRTSLFFDYQREAFCGIMKNALLLLSFCLHITRILSLLKMGRANCTQGIRQQLIVMWKI
jgi:hypothetical protein